MLRNGNECDAIMTLFWSGFTLKRNCTANLKQKTVETGEHDADLKGTFRATFPKPQKNVFFFLKKYNGSF